MLVYEKPFADALGKKKKIVVVAVGWWFAGWLVCGWLVVWLFGFLVGWLVGWLVVVVAVAVVAVCVRVTPLESQGFL